MSRDEKKKQREAVQLAWRLLLTTSATSDVLDPNALRLAAEALAKAFPEYLGPVT